MKISENVSDTMLDLSYIIESFEKQLRQAYSFIAYYKLID